MTLKVRFIALSIGIFLLCYFGYGFAYQQLLNEAAVMDDEYCMKVNPIIIQKKHSFVRFLNQSESDSSSTGTESLDEYFEWSRRYIVVLHNWLIGQKKYMSRWDFQLIYPSEVKQLARLEYVAREADAKWAQTMMEMIDSYEAKRQLEYDKILSTQRKIIESANIEYDRLYKRKPGADWRLLFVKVPTSKCPAKNRLIPEVPDFRFPPIKSDDGPIS